MKWNLTIFWFKFYLNFVDFGKVDFDYSMVIRNGKIV